MGIVQQGKDHMLGLFLRQRIAEAIGEAGEIEAFSIDTATKCILLSVRLDGEAEPVSIKVQRYRVEQSGGHVHFLVQEIMVSRRWLDVLCQRFVARKRFRLPDEYATIVQKLLG